MSFFPKCKGSYPECELIAIVGDTGGGKTSFASAIVQEIFKDKYRKELSEEYVKNKINPIFPNAKVPKSMVYADFRLRSKDNTLESNYLEGWYFGTPVSYHNVKMPAPFSVYVCDEPYRYWDCRDFSNFPEFSQQAFNLHRQFKITVILIYQDLEEIDVKIRRKFHRIIKIQKLRHFSLFGKMIRSKWTYYEYRRFAGKSAYYWASKDDLEPLTKFQKFKLWLSVNNIFYWFPLLLFFYEEKLETKRIVNKTLFENGSCLCTSYSYWGNIYEQYETDFFEPIAYTIPGMPLEEYSIYAQNFNYCNDKCVPKPTDLKGYFDFAQQIHLQRPLSYVRYEKSLKLPKLAVAEALRDSSFLRQQNQ